MLSRRMLRRCCLPLVLLVSAVLAVMYIYLVQVQGSPWVKVRDSQVRTGDRWEGGATEEGEGKAGGDTEAGERNRVGNKLVQTHRPAEGTRGESHQNQSTPGVAPHAWLQNEACPACFGDNLCEEFEDGMIKLRSEVTAGKVRSEVMAGKVASYTGTWDGREVAVTQCASAERMERFERFVCQNASRNASRCDAGSMLLHQDLKALLQVQHLRKAWQILYPNKSSLPATTCMSKPFLKMLLRTFDENGNKRLSRLEQAHLYTALHTCPHLALLKALPHKKLPFPAFLGACGNLVAMETAGKPLSTYLEVKGPWQVRANLSLQLLDMLDGFRNKDPDWLLMFGNVDVKSFAVSADGQLILTDLDAMMVIDKHNMEKPATKREGVCNEDCFGKFAYDLFEHPERTCRQAGRYGDFMAALACRNILGCWETDGLAQGRASLSAAKDTACAYGRGLLYGPPRRVKSDLEDLLTECAEETGHDGRTKALKQIRVLLAS